MIGKVATVITTIALGSSLHLNEYSEGKKFLNLEFHGAQNDD